MGLAVGLAVVDSSVGGEVGGMAAVGTGDTLGRGVSVGAYDGVIVVGAIDGAAPVEPAPQPQHMSSEEKELLSYLPHQSGNAA
jgi:hypothetical protein